MRVTSYEIIELKEQHCSHLHVDRTLVKHCYGILNDFVFVTLRKEGSSIET